jgi:molybdopterin converting factor small subunit
MVKKPVAANVRIVVPPFFQHIVGESKEVSVKGSTAGECLRGLVKKYPQLEENLLNKKGELMERLNIFVDGESAYPEGLAKRVKEGSVINIVYMIVGG